MIIDHSGDDDNDVGQVKQQLIILEGSPLLGGEGLQLHQAAAAEPAHNLESKSAFGLKRFFSPLFVSWCAWSEVGDQGNVVRDRLEIFRKPETLTELGIEQVWGQVICEAEYPCGGLNRLHDDHVDGDQLTHIVGGFQRKSERSLILQ